MQLYGRALAPSFMELQLCPLPCPDRIIMRHTSCVFRVCLLSPESTEVTATAGETGHRSFGPGVLGCMGYSVHRGQELRGDLCDTPLPEMSLLRRNLGRFVSRSRSYSACDLRPLDDPGKEGFLFPCLENRL